MEQLPVRSYTAGVLIAALVVFTGTLSYTMTSHRAAVPPAHVAEAAASPVPRTGTPVPAPAKVTAPTEAVHTVRPGDTLAAISRLYRADLAAMRQANGLTGDQIKAGQRLVIPGAHPLRQHTVEPGDTLWEIAARYDVTVEDLFASNPQVDDPEQLRVGQALVLPDGSGGQQAVAVSTAPDAVPALTGVFMWPVKAPISAPFGEDRGNHMHGGLDLAAQMRDPIHAARDGEVTWAGPINGYGETVILRHADGTRTLYAHSSQLLVHVGDHVKQNQVIALVGSTGNSTGPHLHFEIIVNNKQRDPLLYLPKR